MRRRWWALIAVVAIVGGVGAFYALKSVLHRDRASQATLYSDAPLLEAVLSKATDPRDTGEEDNVVSLMAPVEGETLIGTLSFDYDGDGFDDVVNSVIRGKDGYISLVIGLYNSQSGSYDRVNKIDTKVRDRDSFTISTLDLTGEHTTCLIYQGTLEDSHSILQAYKGSGRGAAFKVSLIADIEASGAIFVQVVGRYESYELYQAKGASYPIWAYSEDKDGSVQTMYNWASAQGSYILIRRTRVDTKTREASSHNVLDGSVRGYGQYLDGLWYNLSGDSDLRYLFFDYGKKEICFLKGDEEEVYTWVNSSIRHNGIFLTTVNSSIQNLERKFDITVSSTDEIRIKLQDDVRMFISEDSLWDGQYKKLSTSLVPYLVKENTPAPYREELYTAPVDNAIESKAVSWLSSDGRKYIFSSDTCDISLGGTISTVDYVVYNVGGTSVIQMRRREANIGGGQDGTYALSYGERKEGNKVIEDHDTLILTPVIATPKGLSPRGSAAIVLYRDKGDGEE